MANPFKIFRKHRKQSLAVLGVLCIFLFTVGTVITQLMPKILGGGAQSADLAVSSKYGKIDNFQLDSMRRSRSRMADFMQRVAGEVARASSNDRAPEAQPAMSMAQQFGQNQEEYVIQSWLLARKAEEIGMVVTDDEINELLREMTAGMLSNESLLKILDGSKLSESALFGMLREELMSMRMRQIFASSVLAQSRANAVLPEPISTPSQDWENFLRLNQQYTIEAAGVPVDSFLAQIPDPNEKELLAFFEEHKDTFHDPALPDPGFRIPRRVSVEYITAPLAQFSGDTIPAADVEQYYNEHKEDFKRLTLPDVDMGGSTTPTLGTGNELPGMSGGYMTGLPDTIEAPQPATPEATTPTEGDATENTTPNTPAPAEAAQPETSAPADATAPAPSLELPPAAPGSATPESTTPDNSGVTQAGPFRLVSYQQETEQPASETPVETATPDDAPATDAATPAETPADDSETETPATDTPASDNTDTSTPAESEYMSLEEVEDQIRNTLAPKRLIEKLEVIAQQMDSYKDEELLALTDPGYVPKQIDLAAIAQQNGMQYHKDEMIIGRDFAEMPIAQAQIAVIVDSEISERGESVINYVFGSATDHTPRIATDADNMYVLWMTERAEEEIPTFETEGVRETVLKQWKEKEARKLAIDKANKLADEARASGKSLAETFSSDTSVKVVETEPFSWMTPSMIPPQMAYMVRDPRWLLPSVSQIVEKNADGSSAEEAQVLVAPGNDFMRTVFSLKQGEIGVAKNQPESSAYVVRVVDVQPMTSVLWDEFTLTQPSDYAAVGLGDQINQPDEAWIESLEKEVDLKWHREPFRPTR